MGFIDSMDLIELIDLIDSMDFMGLMFFLCVAYALLMPCCFCNL